MFQREVADAHRRRAGQQDLRPACRCWRAGAARRRSCSTSRPSAFVPPPKVTSSVVRADPARRPARLRRARPAERVTEAAFGQRRKMLRQSLKTLGRRCRCAARRGRHRADGARRGHLRSRDSSALARAFEFANKLPRMTQMHRQSLTAYGAPLCETVVECAAPARHAKCWCASSAAASAIPTCTCRTAISRSATASSSTCAPAARCRSRSATRSPARWRASGRRPTRRSGAAVAVYPWIGCGQCPACKAGDENICAAPRHLGITVDGGFATHVLVPHPRYLIDYAPLSASFAGALMCSGLTAYAALKRLADRAAARAAAAGRRRRRRLDGAGARARACSARRHSLPTSTPKKARGGARRPAPRRRSIRPIAGARKALLKAKRRHLRGLRFRRLRQVAQLRDRRAGQGRQGRGDRTARRRLTRPRSPCSRSRP